MNARLEVSGAPVDLHAGGYGGLVADPAQVLCRLVASLHDGTGRIAVDGLSSVATGHRTQRPAIVVIDLETSGSGRTVVSASAAAALNVRLVGSQDPAAVGRLLKAHLATRVPPTVRARLATTSGCPPYVMDDQAWPIRAVQHVCTRVFGRPAALEPSGGSIPFVNTFAAAYRVPAVLLGFGLPDDGAHAANERLYLPNFVRGMVACTQLYHELARSAPP